MGRHVPDCTPNSAVWRFRSRSSAVISGRATVILVKAEPHAAAPDNCAPFAVPCEIESAMSRHSTNSDGCRGTAAAATRLHYDDSPR